jgi:monoamine oxidase
MTQDAQPWTPVEEAIAKIKQNDTGPRRHFLILGAGMAGLAAGVELQRLKHTVTIIEGSSRVGGRVHTRRFSDGSHGELGAMRIPMDHDYTHHYINEVGLSDELRIFPNSSNTGFAVIRNVVARTNETDFNAKILPLFRTLLPAETAILRRPWGEGGGPGGVLGHYMKPLFNGLTFDERRALLAGDFSNPKLRALDQISWLNYLRNQTGISPDALELVGKYLLIRMPWFWSMAAIAIDELHHSSDKVLCEIRGGMDLLPTNLSNKLASSTIRFTTKVEAIENLGRAGGVVSLRNTQTGRTETLRFNEMLCTIPFPVLNRLREDGSLKGFSTSKLAAIKGLGEDYTTSTKVLFKYNSRWWESPPDGILGGRSVSEDPILQTYYPYAGSGVEMPCPKREKPAQADEGLFNIYIGDSEDVLESRNLMGATADVEADRPGVLLASYTHNELAKRYCAMDDRAVAEEVLGNLRRFHPRIQEPNDRVVWCWDKNEWSRGAFAITHPGTLSTYYKEAAREEGNIYFAGEHLSIAPGWIQGALESSLREVARIVKPRP